jgi:hypothetical protein
MDWHVVKELGQSAAALVAMARLISLNLAKRFPALVGYLSLLALSHLLGGGLSRESIGYFWLYVALIPVESVVGIFAVRELVALIFANYPGIRTVGRWALYAGIAISVGTSLLLTRVFWYAGPDPRSRWGLFYFETAKRSIILSLVIAIVAIVFVLTKYPLHLGRNTYLSCVFFSAMFLAEAAQLLIDSSTRLLSNEVADAVEPFFICACLLGWAFLMQRQTVPVAARVAFSSAHEDHLVQQLESFNRLMTRVARR